MIKAEKWDLPRVCQGDVFRDIEYIEYVTEDQGIIEVSKIVFPLVLVLTQDCDLEQDHRFRDPERLSQTQDKWLMSVLVAPIYNAEHVYEGTHLSELGLSMASVPKRGTAGEYLKKNERARYHYLEFPPQFGIVPSVIDFKHYFSVHITLLRELKQTHYVCSISNLFREAVTQRFANFLARIGLPEPE